MSSAPAKDVVASCSGRAEAQTKGTRALTSKGIVLPRKLVGRGWLEAFRVTSWLLGWLVSPVAEIECHRHKEHCAATLARYVWTLISSIMVVMNRVRRTPLETRDHSHASPA
jgi:hypothetical protein